MNPRVVAVGASATHTFTKPMAPQIMLLAGLGVEGDAHCGATVKHRSRVARNPAQPNLRQVHLIHSELFEALAAEGFAVAPGDMGENITTRGVDLLALPADTELQFASGAVVRLSGLRDPCGQIDRFQAGLKAAVLGRTAQGELVRKAGVMAVVISGGGVCPGDAITVKWPAGAHRALAVV